MGRARVVVFAHDPGGARAVLKVIQDLQEKNNCQLRIFAEGPARKIYTDAGLMHRPVGEDCYAVLKRLKPEGFLSATSLSSPYDRAMLRAARQLGIPSMAVVDFWGNYRRRFSDLTTPDSNGLECLPDRICSIDYIMTQEMIQVGIPEDRILETGQPVFDDLIEVNSEEGLHIRSRCRSTWMVDCEDVVLLYASQPIGFFYGEGPDNPKYVGFTEWEVSEILLKTLDRLTTDSGRNIVLILRPHPKEGRGYYESLVRRQRPFRVELDQMANPYESILGADFVVGISSIILMEAALMNRVAISMQPNLIGDDPLKSNISGLTFPAYTEEDALRLITTGVNRLHDLESRLVSRLKRIPKPGNAAARIVESLFEMINNRFVQG